jgi:hypothetical protein
MTGGNGNYGARRESPMHLPSSRPRRAPFALTFGAHWEASWRWLRRQPWRSSHGSASAAAFPHQTGRPATAATRSSASVPSCCRRCDASVAGLQAVSDHEDDLPSADTTSRSNSALNPSRDEPSRLPPRCSSPPWLPSILEPPSRTPSASALATTRHMGSVDRVRCTRDAHQLIGSLRHASRCCENSCANGGLPSPTPMKASARREAEEESASHRATRGQLVADTAAVGSSPKR